MNKMSLCSLCLGELKEISNIVYEHFNNNTLFRLFSIEYMKSKMGYKNNFNDLVAYNRQSFNAVINHTLTYNKRYNINAYDINLLKTYARLTKNHISLVDINYKANGGQMRISWNDYGTTRILAVKYVYTLEERDRWLLFRCTEGGDSDL